MNSELEAQATLKADSRRDIALVELLAVLMDRWQQKQTTVIDDAGNITIGLRPLSMRARPVDMR